MFNSTGFDSSERPPEMNQTDDVARNCLWMMNGRACGMLCRGSSELMDHLKSHTKGVREYVCKWEGCSLVIKNLEIPSRFHRHVARHTGVKPFACHICGKGFADFRNVALHRAIHERTKDVNCPICAKQFPSATSCSNHMKIHSGSKPFSCEDCGNRFTSLTAKKAHAKKFHGKATSTPIHKQFSFLNVTAESVNTEMPTVTHWPDIVDLNAIWDLYIADITGTGEVVETPLWVDAEIDPYDLLVPHIDVYFKLVRF